MNVQYVLEKARQLPFEKNRERVYSCVVTKRGKIIAEAANEYSRSHPKQKHYSLRAGMSEHRCFLHSEILCIIRAAKVNPKNCKLIVGRVGATGKPLDSYPCQSCRIAIRECGFIDSVEASVTSQ